MWALTTKSMALSRRATIGRISASVPSAFLRSPMQPLMSLALARADGVPSGEFWKPPWWTRTTIASMPCARRRGTSALTVSASSLKVRPATPVGVTMPGVPFSVMPMKATLTPLKVLMPYGGKSVRPVASSITLAASHLYFAPSKVPGAPEPRPLQLFGSGRPW